MIIQYYHGHIPYEELKDQLGLHRNGITAYRLIEYAEKIGFDAKGIEGNFSSFQKESILFPCIAHIIVQKSYYHYIVLFEMNLKKQYFIVGDPSKGIYKMSFLEFESVWQHVIIVFHPKTPITYIEANTILKDHLYTNFLKEKKTILYIVLLSFMITIMAIFYTTILNHFITMLESHNEYRYLWFSIFLYSFFIILKNLGNYLRNKIFFHVYQRIDFELMNFIFYQILHLPYRYYKNRTTGDMMSRIQDIGVLRSFLAKFILSSIMDFPMLLVSAIGLFFISEQLFFVVLITWCLYSILYFIYHKAIAKKIEKVEEEGAKTTSYMVEAISGYESLFGSNLQKIVGNRFSNQYLEYVDQIKQSENLQNGKQTISQFILDFSSLALLAFGVWLIAHETITLSTIILFHSLFLYFMEPVKNLLDIMEEWKKVKISWERLSNLFYPTKELGIYSRKMIGTIEFQNVNFSYADHPVLKNVNFKIDAGKKVLITGKSGSGKSTILKLLMKYYEIKGGSIQIDQTEISDYQTESIHQNILYISMKEQLFTGPLCNNISLDGKYQQSYQEILKLTEVESIVRKSPLGHYLPLEENGSNLSGGEKQRVILARTLLLPFQILLLDEATSQIDINMERRILKNIFRQFPDRTVLFVSHRIDNADLFDQWIEIENGKIRRNVKKYG